MKGCGQVSSHQHQHKHESNSLHHSTGIDGGGVSLSAKKYLAP